MTSINKLSRPYILLATLTAVLLLSASWGRHYWHEARFTYAVVRFPLQQLMKGDYNPNRVGISVNQEASAAFYLNKFLHLAYLKTLFKLIPPGRGGFEVAIFISLLLMGLAAFLIYGIFESIFKDDFLSALGLACFLLTPVVPYLAGKLMSEVLALFFASLSIWLALRALSGNSRFKEPVQIILITASTLLTVLSRFDFVTLIAGFWTASLITARDREQRARTARLGAFTFLIAAALYVFILHFFNGGLSFAYTEYFKDITSAPLKSLLMTLFCIFSFGGLTYAFALIGLKSERRSEMVFFLLWLLFSAGPMFLMTYGYMVEPRYIVHGLIPLTGLGALGLNVLFKKFPNFNLKVALPLLLMIFIFNWLTIRLMPYEVVRPKILEAVQQIETISPDAAILIPWHYTDFHFLKAMRPEVKIYNVFGDVPSKNPDPLSALWQERWIGWYGDDYLNSPDRLKRLLEERPVYYMGWHSYPPIVTLQGWLNQLGLSRFAEKLSNPSFRDHLALSWVWQSGNYDLKPEGRSGQYEYFRVSPKQGKMPGPRKG